jgi:hypothetical protein
MGGLPVAIMTRVPFLRTRMGGGCPALLQEKLPVSEFRMT